MEHLDEPPEAEPVDPMPLRETVRLAGGRCAGCGEPYAAREVVFSIALGLKAAPRCLTCLARGLERDAADLRTDLLRYIHGRDCYRAAWQEAERLDGAMPEVNTTTAPVAEAAPVVDGTADAAWDAGAMGCGELVMALRLRLRELPPRGVLRVTATDPAAPEDLPAWCRLTGNPLVAMNHPTYLIRRKGE